MPRPGRARGATTLPTLLAAFACTISLQSTHDRTRNSRVYRMLQPKVHATRHERSTLILLLAGVYTRHIQANGWSLNGATCRSDEAGTAVPASSSVARS